jgi:hypothetical protein
MVAQVPHRHLKQQVEVEVALVKLVVMDQTLQVEVVLVVMALLVQ